MDRYTVKFKRLALLLMPTFLRRTHIMILAYSAVSSLSWLHAKFILFMRDTDYRLTHSGQVCYLRGVLNDYFDPLQRRIDISDNAQGAVNTFLYERESELNRHAPERESEELGLIVTRRGIAEEDGLDFWVNIPYVLLPQVDRIKAITNIYKLPSKYYKLSYK